MNSYLQQSVGNNYKSRTITRPDNKLSSSYYYQHLQHIDPMNMAHMAHKTGHLFVLPDVLSGNQTLVWWVHHLNHWASCTA